MLGEIIPIIDTRKANKKLKDRNNCLTEISLPDNIKDVKIKYLEEEYKETIETKNRFEDKAKTILAALTIATTLIFNLSSIIDVIVKKVSVSYFEYAIIALAIISILYMVLAGIMSMQVLIKENICYYIPIEGKKKDRKKTLFQAIQQNKNQNLVRNNIIYAAYISIRNSMLCLVIIFVISIVPFRFLDKNVAQIKSQHEIVYSEEAIEWINNNPKSNINIDYFVEKYDEKCLSGKQGNIYDKKQGIIVSIMMKDGIYCILEINNNIVEIN